MRENLVRSRTDFLDSQFREIMKLWERLGIVHRADDDMEKLRDTVMGCKFHEDGNAFLVSIVNIAMSMDGYRELLRLSLAVDKFGVWNRKCFDLFFRNLTEKGFKEFFPLGMLFMDFDGIKKVNDLCDYEETDKLIGAGLDKLQDVIRSYRFSQSEDQRTFSDLVFQVQSGDEIAAMLARASTLEQCREVETRYHRALKDMDPVKLTTRQGATIYRRPNVTSTVHILSEPPTSIRIMLRDAFQEIRLKKRQKRRLAA